MKDNQQPTYNDLLSGEEKTLDVPAGTSPYIEFKRNANYRPAKSDDEKCENCVYYTCMPGQKKVYHKCDLMGVSHSAATDIKKNSTCNHNHEL